MRNQSCKYGIKPLSNVYDAVTDSMIHLPLKGGGAASVNLAGSLAITRGNPTKITLGSTPSPLPMPGTMVKLSSVTPTDYNGYHKVIAASGADVWIDLDSSSLADWTSGGAMTFNVIYDRFGALTPQDIQGTITGIWANQADGLTSHSAGTYTSRIATPPAAFDLSGFAGFLVVGAKIKVAAAPTADEYLFSIGRTSATGSYSGSGCLTARIASGGSQVVLTFRPRTVAGSDSGGAAGGTNTLIYSTALGTTATRNVVFLLDLRSTSAATCYAYLDGVLKAATSLTLTNLIDWPGITNGMVIGASLNGSLTTAEYLGAAGTPSQARVKDLLWWKTTKSMVTVQRAVLKWSQTGELPVEVI